jgi:hypothetical protein
MSRFMKNRKDDSTRFNIQAKITFYICGNMKKSLSLAFGILAALVLLQTGCNNSNEKKADNNQPAIIRPQDSLKAYIEVSKMEANAYTVFQQRNYDSALARYNKCLDYLNAILSANNNKGLYLFEGEYVSISQSKEAIYDSIKQPENAMKCALECVSWAKRIRDCAMQIKFDLHLSDKLRKRTITLSNDTTKRGAYLRQALFYSTDAAHIIDSLKTNDMDDSRYESFHQTSKIYALLGDKKQAQLYDKKYRDVYFNIYKQQPADK